jgi:hypothetical protein
MSNLYNQNIGINYKGILNLDTTINTPLDATLRAVTDGMGTASPLWLSTQSVAIGATGLDGSLAIRSGLGTTPITLGVRAGGWSNGIISGNDINFISNQTGFVFASGSTWIDALARLHVRGDGTNPIARFENNAGTAVNTVANSGLQTISCQTTGSNAIALTLTSAIGGGLKLGAFDATYGGIWSNNITPSSTNYMLISDGAVSKLNATSRHEINVSGVSRFEVLNTGITIPAITLSGSNASNGISFTQTWNTTGSPTAFFMNITNTASGATANLMDLQVGGVSKLSVKNTGQLILDSTFGLKFGASSTNITAPSNGSLTLLDNAGTSFNRLQLGGTTSSFPAIKRNGANIDFRLADDSGYCDVNGKGFQGTYFYIGSTYYESTRIYIGATTNAKLQPFTSGFSIEQGVSSAISSSAIFQLNSTTQGFLMPRMTQGQILAIAAPANGLMVYNTDLAQPCFYDGTGWKKISHTAM